MEKRTNQSSQMRGAFQERVNKNTTQNEGQANLRQTVGRQTKNNIVKTNDIFDIHGIHICTINQYLLMNHHPGNQCVAEN